MFVEVTEEKLVRGPSPPPPILIRVNQMTDANFFIFFHT